eukprot:2619742-Amphidinium_carterae.1
MAERRKNLIPNFWIVPSRFSLCVLGKRRLLSINIDVSLNMFRLLMRSGPLDPGLHHGHLVLPEAHIC